MGVIRRFLGSVGHVLIVFNDAMERRSEAPWRPLPLRTKLIGWGVLIALLAGAWVLYATHHHGWPIYILLIAAGLVFVNLLNSPN